MSASQRSPHAQNLPGKARWRGGGKVCLRIISSLLTLIEEIDNPAEEERPTSAL